MHTDHQWRDFYTDHRWQDYVDMVNAVPMVTDVVTVYVYDEWQLVCKQPLAKSTHALIELMGHWIPGNPTLVATTALTAHVNYVTIKLYGDNVLHAETLNWQPGKPLNPTSRDRYSWTMWPVDWPLDKVSEQLSAMTKTLFALDKIYATLVRDLHISRPWTAEHEATELFTNLVGIETDEEMSTC